MVFCEEPVQVRVTGVGSSSGSESDGSAPDAFVWRGRLYVVRSVLGHWHERRAWWRAAGREHAQEAPVAGVPSAPAGVPSAPAVDQEVWRVEASPGRLLGSGIYELARGRPATASATASGAGEGCASWLLLCATE